MKYALVIAVALFASSACSGGEDGFEPPTVVPLEGIQNGVGYPRDVRRAPDVNVTAGEVTIGAAFSLGNRCDYIINDIFAIVTGGEVLVVAPEEQLRLETNPTFRVESLSATAKDTVGADSTARDDSLLWAGLPTQGLNLETRIENARTMYVESPPTAGEYVITIDVVFDSECEATYGVLLEVEE